MKMNKIIALSAVATLFALSACNKEDIAVETALSSEEIRIEAGVGDLSKVSYNGASCQFTTGDKIAVWAWTDGAAQVPAERVVNGVVNTLGTEGRWTPAVQMLWKNPRDAHYFLGVYPDKVIENFTADAYTLGADLMVATELSGIVATEKPAPVSLSFSHVLSRLDINLKFRSQWDATPVVTSVATTARNHYTVNYLTKAVTPTGENAQVALSAGAPVPTGYALSYSGLQVPQNTVSIVTVTIDGLAYIFEAAEPIALQSGCITTLGLIVGQEKIELDEVSVTPWVAGTTLPEGEAVIPVTGLSFKERASGIIPFGGSQQLTPIFAPEDATGTDCVWESLDPTIAQVDQNGFISAVFQGKATIKCTCGKQEALFDLFVEPKTGTLVAQASANSTTVSFINRATGPVYYMTSNGVAGVIEAGKTGDISLNAGAKVWFYGDNAAYGNGTPEGSSSISMDKDCLVSGNLMSLVDAANFETATLTEPDAFSYFFSGESHLKNDASNPIVLSAPNLTPGCYKGLFEGCSGLKAIDVKATDISASGATDGWLDGVSSSGQFITPKPSQWCSGGNLPESWTVYEPSGEGSVLAQQAPAVGEGKTGTTITPISGIDAHDGSIHIDSPADLAYSTDGGATWTDVPASGDITGLGLGKVFVHKKAAEPLDASAYVSISLKAVPAYTAPVAKSGLVYSSSAQNLVTAGSTSEGTTMEYKVGSGSWSSSLPTGTNAGNYTVSWRIKGNAQYVDVPESSLGTINIAKAAPTYTAPTAKSGLTHNGSAQTLVNAGTVNGGTFQYKVSSGSWTTTAPSATNAGSYAVSWQIVGDSNHNNVSATSLGNVSIAKKAPSFSVSPSSVSFATTDAVNSTKTATITYDGDGTLSASSNNTGMATVSRNNKTLTITRKSGNGGSVTITVSAAAGTNYSAATNQTITVSLTAVPSGVLLKDAAVGYPVASDGFAYKKTEDIPEGKTVIGMVAYKNGNGGLVMQYDWCANFNASSKDDIVTANNNHTFGSAKLHTTSSTSTTTCYWFGGTKADYVNCGMADQAGFNTVNARRLAAGCEDINAYRTYGTSDGWEFFGNNSTFWYNYWSGGSHLVALLISF